MRPFHIWFARISWVSAVIAIVIQGFALRYLLNQSWVLTSSLIVGVLSATATYIVIYRLLVKSYELVLWKFLLRRLNIEGDWYHELVSDMEPDYRRLGLTTIHQTVWNCEITAVNYNPDFDRHSRTIWQSRAISMDESGRLILTFQAIRSSHSEKDPLFFKEGIMYAHIEYDRRKRPIRIVGTFMDSFPSTKRGAITWMRNAKWKNQLQTTELA